MAILNVLFYIFEITKSSMHWLVWRGVGTLFLILLFASRFFFLMQISVLLARSFPVSPLLLREQPTRHVFRGASQLQLPIWTHPLSDAFTLRGRGRLRLCVVHARQPHPLWKLQPGLCPGAGGLQAFGGRLHRELPRVWDGPPGFGAGLPTSKSRPTTGGIVFLKLCQILEMSCMWTLCLISSFLYIVKKSPTSIIDDHKTIFIVLWSYEMKVQQQVRY